MPIYASANDGTKFTPHPEGSWGAVCVDVYDAGLQTFVYAGEESVKHVVRIYFYCGESTTKDDGTVIPLLVSRQFTLSLHEKANLRAFLEAWRGKKFTDVELRQFDLETLIGAPAFVQVTHNERNGTTYANIDAALKLPKGMSAPEPPADFVRRHIRDIEREANERRDPVAAAAHASRKDQREARGVAGPPKYQGEPEPTFDPNDDLPF